MPRKIVVIGAGIAGLTTTLELVRLGYSDITVIDQFGPGFGSSSKSAGVVETQYLDRSGIHVRDFGLRYFEDFARRYGITLTRSGYLRLGATEEDLKVFQQSVDIQREFGITDPVVLDAEEISARWPRLNMDGRAGGVFGPSDGHVDSYEFCLRAAAVLVSEGVLLMNGVKLSGAQRRPGGGWSLETGAGVLEADVVVNAAGPWAQRVAAVFGADMPQNNQLRPKVKIHHEEAFEQLVPFVMDYVPGSGMDGIYFRSETPNEIFVGIHTDESILEAQDPERALGHAPQEFIDRVMELLPTRLRMPAGISLGRTWTGLYAISPDNKPIVDFHPAANDVVHVMGAGGSGIQLAPAMARIAAELVDSGRTITFAGTDWSLSRFAAAASK
ncbi:NAD(P)/FAD-dependent oxidoreductase [Arthrobacter mobilis]|uniref:FAD-binding oxidoreductase n=1 Tax=Arthrobacter mobilis TaxID=2724944 RepID=A0A7X6K6R7_9MICC|nr:FAD-binding oxidoreductase [Arthrobacter mobilis]NKX55418.1 FAD-binding oxidoreductase [Arthrobacter mobilis]